MLLLVIQCRHHLKNFQRACLKYRTIYATLSPYKPFSQISTANFPSNSMAELASIKKKDTKRTVTSSVSPQKEPQKDTFRRQSSGNASMSSPKKRVIINPRTRATQFGFLAGTFLRHEARSLGFRVLPDGYVRVSEMLTHSRFGMYEFREFAHLVKNDPKKRFEMTFVVDLIDGILRKVWWVRARYGHSIPGVNSATRRILHVGKLGTVYYITGAANWEFIREHGIPEDSDDHLIPLFIKSRCHLFLDDVPVNAKTLRISIDPLKAVVMGVKFFHTKSAQLIATGNRDQTIPWKAMKSVVEVEFKKETLK